jgi:hypothetical protein
VMPLKYHTSSAAPTPEPTTIIKLLYKPGSIRILPPGLKNGTLMKLLHE